MATNRKYERGFRSFHLIPKIVSVICLSLVFLSALTVCDSPEAQSSSIKVGLGETVITPDENVRMAGFARSQVSTGVHDDLHARSIVIEGKNGVSTVLMTITLSGIGEEYAKSIREGITQKTGIPAENIVISATHTHSGPNLRSASQNYQDYLVAQCIQCAVSAWEKRAPGKIGIGSTEVMELGRNRRRLLYGGVHPDPEVGLIKIEDARGKLLGVAFNYGCHPSGLDWHNTLYSEDWPFYAIQGIKKSVGDDVWVAYFQGPEGNINVGYLAELSAVGVDMPVRTYWYIELKGGQMADAVIKALPKVTTSAGVDVKTAQGLFDYPLRDSYPVTVEQAQLEADAAKKILDELEKKPEFQGTRILDNASVDVFQTDQRLRAAKRFYSKDFPKTRSLEQQAVRIGDGIFVTFPGELFSEIGLAIKKGSPLEKTFVIGVTAGPGGYLPGAKDFIEGDYEVNGSVYSPKTEQFCIDSSLSLIRRVVK